MDDISGRRFRITYYILSYRSRQPELFRVCVRKGIKFVLPRSARPGLILRRKLQISRQELSPAKIEEIMSIINQLLQEVLMDKIAA